MKLFNRTRLVSEEVALTRAEDEILAGEDLRRFLEHRLHGGSSSEGVAEMLAKHPRSSLVHVLASGDAKERGDEVSELHHILMALLIDPRSISATHVALGILARRESPELIESLKSDLSKLDAPSWWYRHLGGEPSEPPPKKRN